MTNKRMEEKLEKEECIDVLKIGRQIQPGVYELDQFKADVDYCDAEKELYIWSIGRDKDTGRILASTSAEFYGNPQFTCLWLR